jgi:hypothetical protein
MQQMREELIRRNYAATTIHSYLKVVEHFRRHVGVPLEELGAAWMMRSDSVRDADHFKQALLG